MTILNLIAIAKEDGWAFVRTGNGLIVIRPPYHASDKIEATEEMVEQGISHHGFAHAEKTFPDWRTLIHYVKQCQAETWKKQEESSSDGKRIERLFHEMPVERLTEFLDRVERQLIPTSQWTEAQNVLTTLLNVKNVREQDDLNNRAVSLLKQCQAKRKEIKDTYNSMGSDKRFESRFPRTSAGSGTQEFMQYSKQRSKTRRAF